MLSQSFCHAPSLVQPVSARENGHRGVQRRAGRGARGTRARRQSITATPRAGAAHDFVWRRRRAPYDLVVYQFGNSSHHDYEWAYALSYPGLVVLHDTHLHHARAALPAAREAGRGLSRRVPLEPPGRVVRIVAELAVAGFDSRALLRVADGACAGRGLAPGRGARRGRAASSICLRDLPRLTARRIVSIRLGEGESWSTPERERARAPRVRARYGIAEDAVLFGCFGGLTPEKRLPQILAALPRDRAARAARAPAARGAPAAHYDVAADIAAHGLAGSRHADRLSRARRDLTDHLAACDVTLNLRWPTARETSGPWLRALAAGSPTIITDLVHLGDVPSLDPRTWTAKTAGRGARREDRGTRLRRRHGDPGRSSHRGSRPRASHPPSAPSASPSTSSTKTTRCGWRCGGWRRMRRCAQRLGRAARDWWAARAFARGDGGRLRARHARRRRHVPIRAVDCPAHMRNPGDRQLARRSARGALRRRGSGVPVTITLNGDPHTVPGPSTISRSARAGSRSIRTRRRRTQLRRRQARRVRTTPIEDGDQIEIVNFVGGALRRFVRTGNL